MIHGKLWALVIKMCTEFPMQQIDLPVDVETLMEYRDKEKICA